MPKKHIKRGGGFFDNIKGMFSSKPKTTPAQTYGTAPTQTYGTTPAQTYGTAPTQTYGTAPTQTYGTAPVTSGVGGKKRGGGYKANTPLNGLAFSAAPVSGFKTAHAHNMVGGKTRRRKRNKHRHTKSCKHNKNKK